MRLVIPAAVLFFATAIVPTAQVPAPQSAPRAAVATPLPTPASVFGFEPGADYKLATYDQSLDYFRRLAAASRYIKLVEAGKTTEGRPMVFALISTPENLARIDRLREIWRRLAHPQNLTEAEAAQLAREGKALVHIDGGLHATEVAGAQHTPLLAYDLLSKVMEPATRAMLDNVVVMLWPTINPDGQQMVAEWYMKNVGTPYELSGLPRLYQAYVGHDNNRDAYMLNMIESRVIEHTWREWEPQIIYVHHQSGPFPTRIWLPPFSEPVGIDAPPIVAREVNMIGMAIAKGLDEHAQPGATHMGTAFDAWYPGYIDYAPVFKNIAAFWTETALYQYATPHQYTIDDFPPNFRDLRPQSLYSSPWKPGWWHLRDAVQYMETASLSVIEYASRYKDSLLLDRYKAGRDQIARGKADAPYAYVIPQDQRDPVAAVELLRRLAFGGVRVSQLAIPAAIDGTTYPAGTWVVPTDQEFAAVAREVLDVQHYPDLRQFPGGPPERPYDAAGWTLPLQMAVTVVPAKTALSADTRGAMKVLGPMPQARISPSPYPDNESDAAPFDSVPGSGFDTEPSAAAIVPPPGRVTGEGPAVALDAAQNNAFRAINRAWTLGGGVQFANGRYLLTGLSQAQQDDLVKTLALVGERTDATGVQVRRPRIGLFQPWTGSMDEGWTRWLLERYGFDYLLLHPEDLKTPLAGKVDVVLFADDARIPIEGAGRGGRGSGGQGTQGRGGRVVRPEYAAALNADDVRALEQFVRGGGTFIFVNNATSFPIQQFQLPVRNVVAGLKPEEFFLRGTIVDILPDTAQQPMAGLAEHTAVFADSSPVFETGEGFSGKVLAKYSDTGSPLLSGYLIGEKYMNGKAAALDVQLDSGHIVLLGFRPEWRDQSFGTFKVIFNSLLASTTDK
ncbi:MAG TPA: M14 metallopeptidase family protein [Vicinamibacterales bacterium]|nr:M14 metallopeptidase family protein [Vicinamibacterales bacterium]